VIEPRKCIKCGQLKAPTEYYSGSGNTCKECLKKYQKVRFAQKKLVIKELAENNIEQRLCYNYCRADCWLNGMRVMRRGSLVGQGGRDWWQQKKIRHEKWLRRKRKKETAALPAERLSIEV